MFTPATILALLSSTFVSSVVAAPVAEPGLVPNLKATTDGLSSTVAGTVKTVDSTANDVIGQTWAALEAICSSAQKCTVTVNGNLGDILGDGYNFKGQTTISGWVQNGHLWGSADLAGEAPLPIVVTCKSKTNDCTTTMAGNMTQVFANGKQVELWGWMTPSGKCEKGVCTGSIKALGDPGYKMA